MYVHMIYFTELCPSLRAVESTKVTPLPSVAVWDLLLPLASHRNQMEWTDGF